MHEINTYPAATFSRYFAVTIKRITTYQRRTMALNIQVSSGNLSLEFVLWDNLTFFTNGNVAQISNPSFETFQLTVWSTCEMSCLIILFRFACLSCSNIAENIFGFCEPDIIIKRSLNLDPNTWRCHDVLEIGVGLRNLAPSVLKLNSIMPSTSAIHIKRSERFDSMKTWVFRKANNRISNLGFFPSH